MSALAEPGIAPCGVRAGDRLSMPSSLLTW